MSPKAKQRSLKLIFIMTFFLGFCLFLAGALRENIVYFKTPSEILEMKEIPNKLRLGGLVLKHSLKSKNGMHEFVVTDDKIKMQVQYSGRLPDLFREGQGVVAIGAYNMHLKIFIANQLLVKHDQYYRPKQ